MESPVVPTSRTRLTRDYTLDDDTPPAIKRFREGAPGQARGYADEGHLDSSPRSNSRQSRSDSHERPLNSRRMRGRERDDSYGNGTAEKPYQYHSSEHQEQEDLRKLDFNLDPINEQSTYAGSITSTTRSHVTDARSVAQSGSEGSRLPDFFSSEIFQIVLHNPMTSRQLTKFAQKRLCAENMEYLAAVDRYQTLLNDVAKSMFDIHKNFISTQAEQQINLPQHVLLKLNKDLKSSLSNTLPKLENVFSGSQHDIEQLVSGDLYPRFVRHQMTLSASRALAGNKSKYAGLGDCFVLTDPAKADNPITYASDGFVSVTGYSRNEIIPRNCRFLQNRRTDRNSVRRLRSAIESREESVELLLNERKDGTPFWNLLYVTPLRDSQGQIVFFFGAQINLSTTIHSQSDILRILALSEDVAEEQSQQQAIPAKEPAQTSSRYSRIFSGFRSKSNGVVPKATPGMENVLLERMEKMNVLGQMDAFYTAYSKFLIINATTLLIAFHSAPLTTLLYPPHSTINSNSLSTLTALPRQPSPIGQNAFTYLSAYAPSGSLPSGFKARVKQALKGGAAVSLDAQLCTARYRGFEKFVVHWTPLKGETEWDGREGVGWVVVTLGGGD